MKLTDLKTQYNGEIVLLTKDQCAQCDHMKRRLNRMGESYTEINLEKDPELLADVKAQGARTAPVMLTPRGKLLTTNVVEMENQLKEELKQPRNHHLYDLKDAIALEQQHPDLKIPKLAQQWDTTQGWGETIGVAITDEHLYVYSAEFSMYGADVTTSIYNNPDDLRKSTDYPHLVSEKQTVTEAVTSKITDIISKDVDDIWKDTVYNYNLPALETPREINISLKQWTPAAGEHTLAWMSQSNFEQAALYKWADFTTYLENTDTETALETLQDIFPYIDETKLESLKELTHPKAQSDLAAVNKSAEISQLQHPMENISTHSTAAAPTQMQMPPAPQLSAQQKNAL